MSKEFGISEAQARYGQMAFLITYAFGCELWAPFSEDLGRKWVMQASLFLVNVFQLLPALSNDFRYVIAGRVLGGLSSAGGSVTLGMVADMFEPERQQYPCAYIVFSSVAGSVVAPIVGGPMRTYLDWRWTFWMQLILGGIAQIAHLFVPETCPSVLLDKEAKRRRKQNEDPNIYGPNEINGTYWERLSFQEVGRLLWRPYRMLLTEPIVAYLSLLSGFSDALIFTGLDSFGLVLKKWNFSAIAVGLSFFPLLTGYIIAYCFFLPFYRSDTAKMKSGGLHAIKPERRLKGLVWLVLLEPIGLFGYAWCTLGPPHVHWIGPEIFSGMIGIANYAIYMATIDYMVAAYGPYAASATGGNGFCRDFLAGIAAIYATPFYTNIATGTKWQFAIPTFVLTGIAILLTIPVFVFYVYGEYFRKRSPMAQSLEQERDERAPEREFARSRNATPLQSPVVSRPGTPQPLSRKNSIEMANQRREKATAKIDSTTEVGVQPAYRPTPLSLASSSSIQTKGMGSDGRIGQPRLLDGSGNEVEYAPATSERKGTSMAVPSSPTESEKVRTFSVPIAQTSEKIEK